MVLTAALLEQSELVNSPSWTIAHISQHPRTGTLSSMTRPHMLLAVSIATDASELAMKQSCAKLQVRVSFAEAQDIRPEAANP